MRSLYKFVVAFVGCMASFAAFAAEPVRACAANLEYPPYLYAQGHNDTPAGLAIDILQFALKSSGKAPARVQRLPWLRCLKMVELGEIDLALNVPTAQIDPGPYLISEPYAVVHSVYFVSKENSPHGLKIDTYQDLLKYRVCGLLGYRYESYGIDTDKVDVGAQNYQSLIMKLTAGHCDLFIEKREIVEGLSARNATLKAAFNAPSLLQFPLPEDSPLGLHYAVSATIPGAKALLDNLNSAIAALNANGQMKGWLEGHMNAVKN